MTAALGRIVLYTKRIPEMVRFYADHFGFQVVERAGDRIVELHPVHGGAALLLHPAAKSQKEGQVLVKLVFDVADVVAFCKAAAEKGLEFGPITEADGYCFANGKDPSMNSISVSSRAFADRT
jgi:catechol 2,3-dioxygenase-like lactoylglutathione lyase family enzyme